MMRKRLKNRKGIGSIEIVISSLIIIMIIAGIIDMVQVLQKIDTASQTTGYIARTIQKQGGVQTYRIENYHGKYTTTPILYNNVKEMLASNGIPEEDWRLYIAMGEHVYEVTPSTSIPLADYGQRMRVVLEVDYRWNLLSHMIPVDLKGTKDSVREVLSVYKVRNRDQIESEFSL